MADLFVVTEPRGDGQKYTLQQIDDFGLGGRLDVQQDADLLTPIAAYSQVAWYKRCVDVRARAVASMPWAIYSNSSDDPIWTETTERPPSLEWLDMSKALFLAEVSMSIMGAAYALKQRSGRTMLPLYWYNPATITPEYVGTEVARYKRTYILNGRSVTETLQPQDVLPVWARDPFHEVGAGAPDAAATLDHAQVLYDLAKYASEQLRTGLVERTVFTTEGRRPPEEEARRTESWLTRFIFGRGRNDVKVMSGNLKPLKVGQTLADLASKDLAAEHREAIATGLGVPHSLVMSNASNFATAQADQLNFIFTTIAHECGIIQTAMNEHLLKAQGLTLIFEPDRHEAVQAQQAVAAQATVSLFTAGIITQDEARVNLGWDPLELEAEEPEAEPEDRDDTEEEVLAEDEMAARALDLRRWRTKVERRGRGVKFTPEALGEAEAEVIRERLLSGHPLDDAFAPPYTPSF